MTEFSAAEKWNSILRELKYRKRVYPRWVAEGKMTDGFAAVQIEVMEAIASDYERLAANERLV